MSRNRGRLAFVAVATIALTGVIVVVALSGSDDDGAPADDCIAAWNGDQAARADGAHALADHGYSATLVTRVDENGEVLPSPEDSAAGTRCAVIFATPRVEFEPDFGVRLLDHGRWGSLAQAEGITGDRVAEIQRAATETANAALLPDGRLAPSG